MKIRCLAIDDEPMALEKLKNYISRIPYLELVGACEGTYEAMEIMATESIDAIYIDINMPDVNGFDFVSSLVDPPMVVFTTAYPEYAVESYKIRAVDYLLKPFGFDDFQRSASNLLRQQKLVDSDRHSDKERDYIYIKVDYRYLRVLFDDILYFEGMNEYLKLHLKDADPILTHTTFKNMIDSLPSSFIQVHRSYVINMKHIKEVERSVILLDSGARISISDSYKDAFMRRLQMSSVRK